MVHPWGDNITRALKDSGIEVSSDVICQNNFMSVNAGKQSEDEVWIRSIDTMACPGNYFEKMFPEGLRNEINFKSHHVTSIRDVIIFGEQWLFVITPACDQTLSSFSKSPSVNSTVYTDIFRQVIDGLKVLHFVGYVHGDLCPDNIWLKKDQNNHLTASISGYSSIEAVDFIGSDFGEYNSRYRPPGGGENMYANDTWALGVIIFETLTGEDLVVSEIQKNEKLSVVTKDLLQSMLRFKEEERAKVEWILNHEFFNPKSMSVKEVILDPRKMNLDDRIVQKLNDEKIGILEKLGEGTYGEVFKVKFEDQYRAMKIVYRDRMKNDDQAMKNEEKVSKLVNHKHVIFLVDFFRIPNFASLIVMELALSDLDIELDKLETVDDDPRGAKEVGIKVKRWLKEYAQGLAYLHSIKIVHQDVKPDNCLIRVDDSAAVGDFSLSEIYRPGTARFERAKIHEIRSYGATVEYAMKCVKRLMDRSHPSSKSQTGQAIFVPEDAVDFIRYCEYEQPGQEPQMEDVVNHPWFKEEDIFDVSATTSSRARKSDQSSPIIKRQKN